MNLNKLIFVNNDCYRSGRRINVGGVMVHSTGANNPYLRRYVGPDDGRLGENQYDNHWNMPGIQKCSHAFIGKLKDGSVATYQTLPWDMRGWHCGRSGNDTHISFEICEDGLADKQYFSAVYQEAVELTAYLCKAYNLDPMEKGVVICHKEGHDLGIASDHADVVYWFTKHGKTMDDFRNDVSQLMGKQDTPPETEPSPADSLYRLQLGAFSKKGNAGKVRDELIAAAKLILSALEESYVKEG